MAGQSVGGGGYDAVELRDGECAWGWGWSWRGLGVLGEGDRRRTFV